MAWVLIVQDGDGPARVSTYNRVGDARDVLPEDKLMRLLSMGMTGFWKKPGAALMERILVERVRQDPAAFRYEVHTDAGGRRLYWFEEWRMMVTNEYTNSVPRVSTQVSAYNAYTVAGETTRQKAERVLGKVIFADMNPLLKAILLERAEHDPAAFRVSGSETPGVRRTWFFEEWRD